MFQCPLAPHFKTFTTFTHIYQRNVIEKNSYTYIYIKKLCPAAFNFKQVYILVKNFSNVYIFSIVQLAFKKKFSYHLKKKKSMIQELLKSPIYFFFFFSGCFIYIKPPTTLTQTTQF